jgi:hypothetical protein
LVAESQRKLFIFKLCAGGLKSGWGTLSPDMLSGQSSRMSAKGHERK